MSLTESDMIVDINKQQSTKNQIIIHNTIFLHGVIDFSHKALLNRLYSKVNKSSRVKVTATFLLFHFRFSVIILSVLLQQSKSEFALTSNISSHFLIVATKQTVVTLNRR
jgi:hypothetical protein